MAPYMTDTVMRTMMSAVVGKLTIGVLGTVMSTVMSTGISRNHYLVCPIIP
jgi:hypothetical protein